MRVKKRIFRYTCAYCGHTFCDDNWFIDNHIFGHKAYFDQGCIDLLNENERPLNKGNQK